MGNRKDISDKIVMGGAKITDINTKYLEEINNIDPLHDLTLHCMTFFVQTVFFL